MQSLTLPSILRGSECDRTPPPGSKLLISISTGSAGDGGHSSFAIWQTAKLTDFLMACCCLLALLEQQTCFHSFPPHPRPSSCGYFKEGVMMATWENLRRGSLKGGEKDLQQLGSVVFLRWLITFYTYMGGRQSGGGRVSSAWKGVILYKLCWAILRQASGWKDEMGCIYRC